jgi:very-long-chain enoyl-CoA reductase
MAPFPSLSRAAVEIGVGALQGLISVGNVVDTTPTKTGYSKFSHGVASVAWPVTGRQAMLLIYTPAFLYALHKCAAFSGAWRRGALGGSVWAAVGSAVTNGREPLTAVLLFLHFGKRLAETLFLHRYSSKATDGAVGAFIGVYYLLTSLLVTWAQSGVPAATYNKSPAAALALVAGVGLYVVGQLGNLYHHYLLRALRDNNTGGSAASKEYVVPRGGLFAYVVTPHYLFEIIAWAGVAVVTQQANVALVAVSMASYLAGRARETLTWYIDNVKGFPRDRKAMVPFLF